VATGRTDNAVVAYHTQAEQDVRASGLPWRTATSLGILMNTRGLMELVVLNIGFDLGILSPALFTMMVLMALLTTFMTSPLLKAVYLRPLDRASAAAVDRAIVFDGRPPVS